MKIDVDLCRAVRLLAFAPVFYDTMKFGRVVVIDGRDDGIRPHGVCYFPVQYLSR